MGCTRNFILNRGGADILVCRRVCEWWHSCHPSRVESVRKNTNVRQAGMPDLPDSMADKNVRPTYLHMTLDQIISLPQRQSCAAPAQPTGPISRAGADRLPPVPNALP